MIRKYRQKHNLIEEAIEKNGKLKSLQPSTGWKEIFPLQYNKNDEHRDRQQISKFVQEFCT